MLNVLVDEMPLGLRFPTDMRPVQPATSCYGTALALLARRLGDGSSESRVLDAAENAAKSAWARCRLDAVLLPRVFADREPDDRLQLAAGLFMYTLEQRGLMTLVDGYGPKGRCLTVTEECFLVWTSMREQDPAKRADLWRQRWQLVLTDEEEWGQASHARQLIGRYVADDPDVVAFLESTDSGLLGDLRKAQGRAPAVPWRRAVRELERLPAA